MLEGRNGFGSLGISLCSLGCAPFPIDLLGHQDAASLLGNARPAAPVFIEHFNDPALLSFINGIVKLSLELGRVHTLNSDLGLSEALKESDDLDL